MALEHFKTQILLLHSEQSTLDNLSHGFSDRYTVHCATSGSEALTTLGETQIDVIVTAQDLPGMSGLDALREAKKRSPETIGILLAGNADAGLEALVGDKEVFQVVRGSVTADSLRGLIDSATQQSRLLALAESANDTTANVDEPVTEHIVMETSENGSAIISDGTGQVPVLNPQKVSAAMNVGAKAVDVLVLTQDEEFLATIRESSRGLHNVIYANTLQQADEAVQSGKTGVAVVDAAMVGSNVEKLTMHLRASAPRLVAIVAGRRDDGEMLMDLINRGKVYRFLLKPVSPGRARLAVEASVKHHLEAPDSAFKAMGAAAAVPQPKAEPKPQPRPTPAQSPKAAAKAAAEAVSRASKKPKKAEPLPISEEIELSTELPTIKVEPRPVPMTARKEDASPLDDGLSDAFGGDDSSFTETMTGLVKSVGRSFSSGRDKPATDPSALDSGGGSFLADPKILGGTALALVAVIGLGFWLFGGSDESPTPATDTETIVTDTDLPVDETPVPGPEASSDDSAALLDEARRAASAGQIVNPPGSNAIELYLAAADSAPGNATIEAELTDVLNQALAIAETALLNRRAGDAEAALQRVALADASNARLPFLRAQLAQIQLRNYLDDARLAIRETRYEDARGAIIAARALDVDAALEIDAVDAELSDALSAERVDDVIDKANARLAEGKLIAPSNDNARYYFELAISNDPGNSAARQGLTVVASKLVLQARERIDAGEFDSAEALLVDARRLNPSSQELASTASALDAARQRIVDQRRRAAERAAAEKAAAEQAAADRKAAEQAAAERAAAEQLAAEKAAAEKAAADKAAADQLAADRAAAERLAAETAAAEKLAAEQAASRKQAEAARAAATARAEAAAQSESPTQATNLAPVAVSTLKRIKYVAPKYPRSAQRRNISGWVDVVFTVDIDGTVADLSVRGSDPGVTFVNAALDAVEDWQFEPIIENGIAVQKRAAVRMMFALE